MRTLGAAILAAVLLTTSACGGGGGGGSRPSADEVSKSLQSGKANALLGGSSSQITDTIADCLAKAIVGSKLSDGAVKALVDGDKNYKANSADTAALTSVSAGLTSCAKAAVPTPAPTATPGS
ncbi:MAG: hypothetical protein JWP74_2142 [Marmoricola sp.]|nr:hypothetical protein [Marmoricola sp.]